MNIDALLSRLDGVRVTGKQRWVARCPAHEDKHPSLSLRELDDGRILIHDFAGCSAMSILAAIGLEMSDLFPTDDRQYSAPRERRPFNALDVLRCIYCELVVVCIAAQSLAQGKALSGQDHERLLLAASRVSSALEVAGG